MTGQLPAIIDPAQPDTVAELPSGYPVPLLVADAAIRLPNLTLDPA